MTVISRSAVVLAAALMALLIAGHIYLVRLHGIAEHGQEEPASPAPSPADATRPYRFFPEHLARSMVVFAAVLAIILALSAYAVPQSAALAYAIMLHLTAYLPKIVLGSAFMSTTEWRGALRRSSESRPDR